MTILRIFIFMLVACASGLRAATLFPASLARATVQASIDSASNGDVIMLPDGAVTYTAPLDILDKCLYLQSINGTNACKITASFVDANKAIIYFEGGAASRSANLLTGLQGVYLDCNDTANGVMVYNDSPTPVTKVRIGRNLIVNASNHRSVYIRGSVYGVGDHNRIHNSNHGMDAEGFNADQWNNLPIEIGTSKNFYFEDNDITTSTSTPQVGFAGGHGGRYVARYNKYRNLSSGNVFPVIDFHGNQPPDLTGQMVVEVYGNDIDFGTAGGRFIDQRGGTAMLFYNKQTYGADAPIILIREEYLDSNYPPGNSWVMHAINTYVFKNLLNGSEMVPQIESNEWEDTYDLALNTDVFQYNASYNGTTQRGIYVGTTLPGACTMGDGAWITTQSTSSLTGLVGMNPTTPLSGSFYKATAPNTWTLVYTPYPYPHPLIAEVEGGGGGGGATTTPTQKGVSHRGGVSIK